MQRCAWLGPVVVTIACSSNPEPSAASSKRTQSAPAPAAEPPVTKEASDAPPTKAPVPEASDPIDQGRTVAPGEAYETPTIEIEPGPAGPVVTIEVTRKANLLPPKGTVKFSTEPYNLHAPIRSETVDEADIMGTGWAVDLDGDGKTTSTFPVACDAGRGKIGSLALEPVNDGSVIDYHDASGKPRVRQFPGGGAWLMQFAPCDGDIVSVGISPKDEPFEFIEVPSPALGVVVFEASEEPTRTSTWKVDESALDEAALSVEFHTAAIFEAVTGPDAGWHAITYALVPLPRQAASHEVQLQLSAGGGKPGRSMVAAILNEGGSDHDRVRGTPAIVPIP